VTMKKIIFLAVLIALVLGKVVAQDVIGSQDHPLITRYPNSVIAWYDQNNFTQYHIATGPCVAYKKIDQWMDVEGKTTRIYYTLSGLRTMTEVYRNYYNAVKKAGFTVLAEGIFQERNVSTEVGGSSWMPVFYDRNPFPSSNNIKLLQGSSDTGGHCYIAAKLKTESGMVYISIGGHQYTQNQVVFLVDVIEIGQLEDGLITVDAKAMGEGIDREGKIALYGIHFDFDKADILPQSEPVLAEIAKLLQARPSLKLYVVGHTDMKGGLDYNIQLSEARANAVVRALVQKHGIAAARLMGKGVGPLAPVSTNLTDAGRALNRRVELVQQ
jgi:OOP family OmpA-OmpF porin